MGLWLRTRLSRFSARWVPPHLRRTYPADFTLFLALLGLMAWYTPPNTWQSAFIVGSAGAGAVFLFVGWLFDAPSQTRTGALVSTAVWAAQLAYSLSIPLVDTIGPFADLAVTLSCLAFINLSVGVWALLLPAERRGRWWVTRPLSD